MVKTTHFQIQFDKEVCFYFCEKYQRIFEGKEKCTKIQVLVFKNSIKVSLNSIVIFGKHLFRGLHKSKDILSFYIELHLHCSFLTPMVNTGMSQVMRMDIKKTSSTHNGIVMR